ncbi:hypothetical protein B0H14DRAFT_2576269 [Mycena olivaceomarginata]|nr:hypothetical protein B0H14DRAFT_2576269 [Mycena olivaceomarginata]
MAAQVDDQVEAARKLGSDARLTDFVPFLFDVRDGTWSSILLFGPPSYAAKNPKASRGSWIVTLLNKDGTGELVDVRERLKNEECGGGVTQNSAHPGGIPSIPGLSGIDTDPSKIRLEALLCFLLWNGFPSFLHANLVNDLQRLRAEGLIKRGCGYQTSPTVIAVPGITTLPADWEDPRAGKSSDFMSKVGFFSSQGLIFSRPPSHPDPPAPSYAPSSNDTVLASQVKRKTPSALHADAPPEKRTNTPLSPIPDSELTTPSPRAEPPKSNGPVQAEGGRVCHARTDPQGLRKRNSFGSWRSSHTRHVSRDDVRVFGASTPLWESHTTGRRRCASGLP